VRVIHGDTDRTPYGWGTFASRSLVISGGASLLAAQKIRKKLLTIASHVLEAATDDIVLEDGNATVSGTDRTVTIASLARAAYHQTHRFKGEITPGLNESADYDPPGTFSNACHVAIVEVDVETGRVSSKNSWRSEDAGRIINPMIADGQVHGGIAQGIGNALLEEIVYDALGNIQTATLADYMPPTAHEIPPIELHHIETPAASSITGAKGLGEGGAIGAPAAVINAVNDALSPFGVEIDECRQHRSASARRCAVALDFIVRRDLRHGAGPSDLALFQHVGAVRNRLGEAYILFGQQDRKAALLQFNDGVGDLLNDYRRNAFGRFIEQHDQRIAHQRARDGQHLLLAAAHATTEAMAHLAEVWKQPEQGVGRPPRRRAAVLESPRRLQADVKILQHGEAGKMRRSSGVKPTPSRAISNGLRLEMSRPLKRTVPLRRPSMPMIVFMVVDLPAPLRPISATTSPRPTSRLTS
jgi:hypothetical protein